MFKHWLTCWSDHKAVTDHTASSSFLINCLFSFPLCQHFSYRPQMPPGVTKISHCYCVTLPLQSQTYSVGKKHLTDLCAGQKCNLAASFIPLCFMAPLRPSTVCRGLIITTVHLLRRLLGREKKNDVLGLQTNRIVMWSATVCVCVSMHVHQETSPRSKPSFLSSGREGLALRGLNARSTKSLQY